MFSTILYINVQRGIACDLLKIWLLPLLIFDLVLVNLLQCAKPPLLGDLIVTIELLEVLLDHAQLL